ncbi:reverse transcriptase, partial [Phytophthora megakarya]
MNFMFSAGVRLCVKEGLVQLPDEETVLLSGRGLSHVKHGMAHGIRPKYTMYLQPGGYWMIRLPAFRKLMRPSTVWAGRGDRWVTQVLYAWKVPAAIKVVNISDRIVTIDWRTEFARVVENGFFPRAGRYVHTLIYENTISAKAQARESQRLDDLQKMEPPTVQTPNYPWPTKMMVRPSPGCEKARVLNLQIVPSEVYDETPEVDKVLSRRASRGTTTMPEVSEISEVEDGTTDVPIGDPEEVPDDQDSDEDGVFDSISVDDGFPEVNLKPLIDDLLVGFEDVMWFMSWDMASGFWAVKMSERAKLISAFVCPFGHFQWTRMPFGLKNAPLIYQSVINNCRWGFVRLPPEEEAEVDQDIITNLKVEVPRDEVKGLTDFMTVFQKNIPMPSHIGPVLGRSPYMDNIAHGAKTWDQLCEDLDTLLYRLRSWNISVSLPESEFGKRSILYLSHEISAESIRATPKVTKGVMDLPFPNPTKVLNYYHKFIEDFPVVTAVLYELSEDQIRQGRDLSRAHESFELLKRKIVATPMLRYPDIQKPFVVIPHGNRWAACAVVGQEYDGQIQPVRYTGRVLNDAELRYHIAEKEVIAILRALKVFQTILEGRQLIM